MQTELNNGLIRLEWDENGDLNEFTHCRTGRRLVNPHSICRIILGSPDLQEFEAFPAGRCRIEKHSDTIMFHYDRVSGENGKTYAVELELHVRLCGDEIFWTCDADNRTEDVTVREIHYPVFSIRDPQPPLKVHTSELVSTTYPDLPGMLRGRFSHYMAPDHEYIRHTSFYPGRTSSMNFFILDYGGEILYYGCHDPEFQLTGHNFEIEKGQQINCFMARFPFLRPHQHLTEKTVVTALFSGSWMNGVRRYRQWADSWFSPPRLPDHIRKSLGWQRLIMHHQYGQYFFRYSDLPGILDTGLPSGIDTIFLFGWTQEGMDSGYPEYTPDPSCGGFDELRKNILKVREKGGHVIIYYNGQLIDAASEYYRNGGGQQVSIKRMDGTEHREFYNFSNTGTFLRNFGNKTFAVACPSCREWRDILKRHIDLAFSLGADGVFFDQLGLASYPCCDPSHGHPVPFTGLMQAKRDMCRELYEYAKEKDSQFAFGVECPTDQIAQYCDFIHIFGNTAQVWNPDFRLTGERALLKCEAPLFSAAFPEIYLSDRDIRDDSNVVFPVNQLFLQQRRSDVEIYRCRANLAAAPQYGAYLEKANRLRSRFRDILLQGKMTDETGLMNLDPAVLSNAFHMDDRIAIVLTQSSKPSVSVEINLPGYLLIDSGSIRDDAEICGTRVTLPCDSLAVLLFQRSGETHPVQK
ncbi:MAG: hypothetical protein J5858_08285 [Lentisphaeria bacterium]|nr:hypothetical protein [Lentisphaeria bacterium]